MKLFFLVSAFTLFLSLDSRYHRAVLAFFIRRLFRILPLFWTAAFYYWWDHAEWFPLSVFEAPGFAKWVSFLGAWDPLLLHGFVPGGWSINVEMTFYLIVPLLWLLLTNLTRLSLGLAASLAIVVLALSLHIPERLMQLQHPGADFSGDVAYRFRTYWLPAQRPVFVLGMLVYHLRANPRALTAGFFTIGLFTFTASTLPYQQWLAPVSGLALIVRFHDHPSPPRR